MYQVLGAENFKLGDKYNLVFKFAQCASSAVNLLKPGVFTVSSSGMRFQNYETAIGKVGGNKMQALTYNIFHGINAIAGNTAQAKNTSSGIMTFTLEAQICSLTILFQNLFDNTEYTTGLSNTYILFDIYKCLTI
jgi:hypothetical protein